MVAHAECPSSDLHTPVCRMTSLCSFRMLWNACFLWSRVVSSLRYCHASAYSSFFRHPPYCAFRIRTRGPDRQSIFLRPRFGVFEGGLWSPKKWMLHDDNAPPPCQHELSPVVNFLPNICINSAHALFARFSTCELPPLLKAENAAQGLPL